MVLTPFHKIILDPAKSEPSRRTKVRCGGEQPSCGRCIGKGQFCRYDWTENEEAVQRAAAEHAGRQREAFENAASAPYHRYVQPRPEGPVTEFGEPAAAPISPPPHPEQINRSQIDPVESSADFSQYTPTLYTATQNSPTPFTSTLYTPSQLNANQFAPSRFGQKQFGPNHFGETLGSWNPRPTESSQYSQGADLMSNGLEDQLDEASQYSQQCQLARTNYTQPQYGQLPNNTQPQYGQLPYYTQPQYGQLPYNTQPLYEQPPYNRELDFAAGSSTDQFGGISRYPRASNMVYDGAATWQDTYLPNQYQAGMGSMFVGLPAGNSYNAQTPMESGLHIERARTPAYIAAMMPLWEDVSEWGQ